MKIQLQSCPESLVKNIAYVCIKSVSPKAYISLNSMKRKSKVLHPGVKESMLSTLAKYAKFNFPTKMWPSKLYVTNDPRRYNRN